MTNSHPICSICGGEKFIPSLAGRVAKSGQNPKCSNCGSLERHRIVRKIYNSLPDEFLKDKSALQFSTDPGIPQKRFANVVISVFEAENSLDITNINKPDNCFDWVIANHVLEHVKDDVAAFAEMLRIVNVEGIVQVTVPTPHSQLWTKDWGYADESAYGHYRGYGSDLPNRFGTVPIEFTGVQIIGWDSVVTGRWDIVYFFSPTKSTIERLAKIMHTNGFPVIAA